MAMHAQQKWQREGTGLNILIKTQQMQGGNPGFSK